MATGGPPPPVTGSRIWGPPLGALLLVVFSPLLLLPTRFAWLAMNWVMFLLLAIWIFAISAWIGAMAQAPTTALNWAELRLRRWVARFAPEPGELWLHWAREAHRPAQAYVYLEEALRLGGAEALFQEGLIFLEGGFGAGGQGAAVEYLRRAAGLGHPEAAFRLAECLRTGVGAPRPEPAEAVDWYRKAVRLGFGPAAVWLARACQDGDGMPADAEQARHWTSVAASLQPHAALSHSLLRHDAAPVDPLVRWSHGLVEVVEGYADRVVRHRWGLLLLKATALFLGLLWLFTAGLFFWAGSSGLFHLPLIFMAPALLGLAWMAIQHRRDGPPRGRDPLREAADSGDPEACYRMGLRHREGSHLHPRDSLEAALWFRKAAEAGHAAAMRALAEAYLGGHGVLRDPREAARWAESARRESTS